MSDSPTVSFGNAEVELSVILELTKLAGPIGEDDNYPDAIFLRFEAQTYTRAQVLRIIELITAASPNECGMSKDDLRLWWD